MNIWAEISGREGLDCPRKITKGDITIDHEAFDLVKHREMTRVGRNPVSLPHGETRTYLVDGDEIIFRATARRDGYASIGFGECRGTVTEALAVG